MRRLITIDGPAGVGKSALAKRVADALGVAYLDTGAMFRTLAATLGEQGLTLPPDKLKAHLAELHFTLSGAGAKTSLACNGVSADQKLRTEAIGMLASKFAALPEVRAYLKTEQQALGRHNDLVAEGRDMGTAVFPEAGHKFFLDATPEVRAMRRVKQLAENGIKEDVETVTRQIAERDHLDRTRPIAPLVPAKDALRIDTSTMTIDEVYAMLLQSLSKP